MAMRLIFRQCVLKFRSVILGWSVVVFAALCAESVSLGRVSETRKTNSIADSPKPNSTNCYIACEQIVAQCEKIIEAKCIEKSYSCARNDFSGSIAMHVDSIDIEKLNTFLSYLLSEYSDGRFESAKSILKHEEATAKIGAEILYKRKYNEIKNNMSDREYVSFLALLYLSKGKMYHNFSDLMSVQMEKSGQCDASGQTDKRTNAKMRAVKGR